MKIKTNQAIIICATVLLINNSLFSQTSSHLGFNVIAEKVKQSNLQTTGGIMFEQNLNKHNSIQVEANYRTFENGITLPQPNQMNSITYVHYRFVERFLAIPVTYKYNTDVINFSAGTTVDLYLGYKQNRNDPFPYPLKYETDKKVAFGILTKVSKSINLNNRIIIEPSIRYNPVFSSNKQYLGLAIETKYKL